MVVAETGPTAAWAAGAAKPRIPAASPLAMMVANPNFFIAVLLSFSGGSIRVLWVAVRSP
jgi:hypothetical protein